MGKPISHRRLYSTMSFPLRQVYEMVTFMSLSTNGNSLCIMMLGPELFKVYMICLAIVELSLMGGS